jgi:hypothetical protein
MSADVPVPGPQQANGGDAFDGLDALGVIAPGALGPGALGPGVSVEVFSRFSRRWVAGFEIAGKGSTGYRVRRFSDRSVLPVEVEANDVRAAHPSCARSARS